jgi:hypothetical protein
MPRLNVIVIDQLPDDPNAYRYVLWADVPVGRQARYAKTGATSLWPGATAADNNALATGAMVEFSNIGHVLPGTTLAQIETFLQNQWQQYQNYITNNNPWLHSGSTWDGATWTITSNP